MPSTPPEIFSTMRFSSIRPAVQHFVGLGHDLDACLTGTGVTTKQFNSSQHRIYLDQEFRLFENIVALSASPCIGVELGASYQVERLGTLGLAQLSAKTIEESIKIASRYSPLTTSFFKLVLIKEEQLGGMGFEKQYEIPSHLVQLYSDMAVSGTLATTKSAGLRPKHTEIRLMHNDKANSAVYEELFGCNVEFGHHRNEILVCKADLQLSLPRRNLDESRQYLSQCRKMIRTLGSTSEFMLRVKKSLLSDPSHFPPANEIAKRLGVTPRTLRRKLSQEGVHYQTLLNDIRFEQAKSYLKSQLSLEEISTKLGYSEVSAFSNAFKSWESISPSEYRRSNQRDR